MCIQLKEYIYGIWYIPTLHYYEINTPLAYNVPASEAWNLRLKKTENTSTQYNIPTTTPTTHAIPFIQLFITILFISDVMNLIFFSGVIIYESPSHQPPPPAEQRPKTTSTHFVFIFIIFIKYHIFPNSKPSPPPLAPPQTNYSNTLKTHVSRSRLNFVVINSNRSKRFHQ